MYQKGMVLGLWSWGYASWGAIDVLCWIGVYGLGMVYMHGGGCQWRMMVFRSGDVDLIRNTKSRWSWSILLNRKTGLMDDVQLCTVTCTNVTRMSWGGLHG